jgi:hypothetical protein
MRPAIVHGLLVTAATCGAVRAVGAEPRREASVRLKYERRGAAACTDEAGLRNAVGERLGYDPFASETADALAVTVTRSARGYRGEVRWEAGRHAGEARVIETKGTDCQELSRVLALTVSIAIDPVHATEVKVSPAPSSNPSAPAEPQSVPRAEPAVPAAPEPAPLQSGTGAGERDAQSAPIFALVLGGHTSTGFSPRWTAGISAGGEIGLSRVSFGLEGRLDLPSSEPMGAGRVEVSTALVTGVVCARLGSGALCTLGRVGSQRGEGIDFAVNGSGSTFLASAGVRARYDVPIVEPLRVRFLADLDVPLTANSFDVDGQPAWTVSSIAASLGVGILLLIH